MSTHTAERYDEALNAAQRDAGNGGDGYNARFIASLARHALALSPDMPPRDDQRYPGGLPYTAPRPYPFESLDHWPEGTWPPETYVVWTP